MKDDHDKLEAVVKSAKMWPIYLEFITSIEEMAREKYPKVSPKQREHFINTCRHSFCAGVNEAFRFMLESIPKETNN